MINASRLPGAVAGTALDPKEHHGHVAIVEVKGGSEKNVIEAVSKGVIRTLLVIVAKSEKKGAYLAYAAVARQRSSRS